MNTITIRPFATAKLILFTAAAVALLSGCELTGIGGSGRIVTENRSVTDFSTIEAHGAFSIDWAAGAPSCTISTDDNLMRYIDVRVDDHKLVLESHETLRPTRGFKVRVSSARLTGAALHGAVRLFAANLTGQNFFLDGEGATRVELSGSVNELTASMAGASRLDAEGLRTQAAELSISGAGRAEVSASERLRVDISGAGKVLYAGNPRIVEKHVSGAGSIHRRD